eukprot:EG_transcript_26160
MPGRIRRVGSTPTSPAAGPKSNVVKDHPDLLGRSIAFNPAGGFDPIQHPNVAQCSEAYTEDGVTFVVVERASGGTLRDRLAEAQAFRKPLSEGQALQLFLPIALGLQALHAASRVHGRPHSGNCVFAGGVLKLSMDSEVDPDTVLDTPTKAGQRTEKTDLWFLGSILYEICTLHPLLCGVEPPPWPSAYSPELQSLCESLLHADPAVRPSLKEMFGSKFVQEACRRLKMDAPSDGKRLSK